MGVYIPRAVKPTDCEYCLFNTRGGKCYLTAHDLTINDCPLIEIPTPHGRLIDADKLKMECYRTMDELMKSTTINISAEALSLLCGFTMISEAPTILETEE